MPCGSFGVSVSRGQAGTTPTTGPRAREVAIGLAGESGDTSRPGEQRGGPVARKELAILMDCFLVRSPWPPSGYFPGGLMSINFSLVAFILFQSLR